MDAGGSFTAVRKSLHCAAPKRVFEHIHFQTGACRRLFIKETVMAQKILLKHPQSGLVTTGFYGFSWTTLFFGFFPALFRKDFMTFGVGLVIYCIVAVITAGLGALVASIAWAFMYNKYYTRKLIAQGYRFAESDTANQLAASALGVSLDPTAAISAANA
jgi:hypothetical protein